MTKSTIQLSEEARRIERSLVREWDIKDKAGRFILRLALEAFDEQRAAQAVLATEGAYLTDRFGQTHLHPACQREKEARAHCLQFLRQLDLDLESLTNATKTQKR